MFAIPDNALSCRITLATPIWVSHGYSKCALGVTDGASAKTHLFVVDQRGFDQVARDVFVRFAPEPLPLKDNREIEGRLLQQNYSQLSEIPRKMPKAKLPLGFPECLVSA
jgi:hypothetical protein